MRLEANDVPHLLPDGKHFEAHALTGDWVADQFCVTLVTAPSSM